MRKSETAEMSGASQSKYLITPAPPEPLTEAEKPRLTFRPFGVVLLLGLIAVASTILQALAGVAGAWALAGMFTLCCGVAGLLWLREYHENLRTQERRKADVAAYRAATLSSRLGDIFESSAQLSAQLPDPLSGASGWLQQADSEFRDNAFAPFWDAVEQATRCLDSFQQRTRQLAKNAEEYHAGLKGRNHNFPIFPARLNPCLMLRR